MGIITWGWGAATSPHFGGFSGGKTQSDWHDCCFGCPFKASALTLLQMKPPYDKSSERVGLDQGPWLSLPLARSFISQYGKQEARGSRPGAPEVNCKYRERKK